MYIVYCYVSRTHIRKFKTNLNVVGALHSINPRYLFLCNVYTSVHACSCYVIRVWIRVRKFFRILFVNKTDECAYHKRRRDPGRTETQTSKSLSIAQKLHLERNGRPLYWYAYTRSGVLRFGINQSVRLYL